ncbi:MAG: hypothetical protein ACR2P1_24895 [Pseudomonadales bacterium]
MKRMIMAICCMVMAKAVHIDLVDNIYRFHGVLVKVEQGGRS